MSDGQLKGVTEFKQKSKQKFLFSILFSQNILILSSFLKDWHFN